MPVIKQAQNKLFFLTHKRFLILFWKSNNYQQPRVKPLLNRMFYYIHNEDFQNYCSQIPGNKRKIVAGTRKIHQVFTNLLPDQKILNHQLRLFGKVVLNKTLIIVLMLYSLNRFLLAVIYVVLPHMILVVIMF